MDGPLLGGPKYLPGVGVRGLARRAFSMLRVLPSYTSPCKLSLAASASSAVTIFTKPKPRLSRVWGSRMMLHFSTCPYFSNRRVISSSVRRGWMPVTNKLEPELTETSLLPSRGGPPLHKSAKLRSLFKHVGDHTDRARSSARRGF